MGARIAAHFANAGVPSYLLDMVPPEADTSARNKIAATGLEAATKSKPGAFFEPSLARLVTIGNFEDDLKRVAEVDWIIEAVVEDLEIKRALLKKVEAVRKPGTIIATNTSGLPVGKIAEGFSEDFRRCWFGTHFFNPPRYMRLLELIHTAETDRSLMDSIAWFCDVRLGKGVVIAKDTPNFIANRIGTFSVLNVLRQMQALDMTIEEVDACTGPAIGQPKSATFRTADIVGLDVLVHVVRNIYENAPDDESREMYRVPPLVEEMMKRGWLGEKTGGGFYKRVKKGGDAGILTLDWHTMDYRPRQKAKFGSIEAGKAIEDTRDRLRALVAPGLDDKAGDKANRLLWSTLRETCLYAARRMPEVANSIVDVDRAMHWGFAWELGPFEVWDAIGVERMSKAIEQQGKPVPPLVEEVLR